VNCPCVDRCQHGGKYKHFNVQQPCCLIKWLSYETQAQKAIATAEKQQADVDKAAKKALKDKELEELHLLKLPICTLYVSEGLTHWLLLNLDPIKEILKHVFNITESNMRKPWAIELLTQALILNPSN
jgi:hypothetical protein